MSRILQLLFFVLIVRPFVYVIMGLNVRNWQRLPTTGPAILVANHNSHLDTLVLMSLLPVKLLPKLRPLAAADYFLRNRLIAWLATRIIGIIPVYRKGERKGEAIDPLAGCYDALDDGDILILFPEGTRGSPGDQIGEFRKGVEVLARNRPDVSVHPVCLYGLSKILPKGAMLPLPFCCDVFVKKALKFRDAGGDFMPTLVAHFQ